MTVEDFAAIQHKKKDMKENVADKISYLKQVGGDTLEVVTEMDSIIEQKRATTAHIN